MRKVFEIGNLNDGHFWVGYTQRQNIIIEPKILSTQNVLAATQFYRKKHL